MKPEYNEGDSDALLKNIASQMREKGKQARDRFLFVLNRMDERKKADIPLEEEIHKVKEFLSNKGIEDAKVFPISAQAALDIRRVQKGVQDDEVEDDANRFIDKLNKRSYLHLENYAPLSGLPREVIAKRLAAARAQGDKAEEALIHTGLPSVELAICQYVCKYAKMMNIKSFASVLENKIQEKNALEKTKEQVIKNREEYQQNKEKFDSLQRKLTDGTAAQAFEARLKDESTQAEQRAQKSLRESCKAFEAEIFQQIEELRGMGQRVPLKTAKKKTHELSERAECMEAAFCTMVDREFTKGLQQHAERLYQEYRSMLKSMTADLPVLGTEQFSISPLNFVQGQLGNVKELLKHAGYKERVKVGEHEVEERAPWYNIYRKFFPRTYIVEDYKQKSYVDMSVFAQGFLAPIQEALHENVKATEAYIKEQTQHVTQLFSEECKKLNTQLAGIMKELDACAADTEGAEQRLAETQRKLAWLEQIPRRMDDILAV